MLPPFFSDMQAFSGIRGSRVALIVAVSLFRCVLYLYCAQLAGAQLMLLLALYIGMLLLALYSSPSLHPAFLATSSLSPCCDFAVHDVDLTLHTCRWLLPLALCWEWTMAALVVRQFY
jgi:hypothetical protein